jgi:TetR/AcrR family transcriptional repressor of nem operon
MGRNKNFIQEEVLDKAIEIFKLKGFRGTSPEELVNYLGISRSSLYSTFGDKNSLLMMCLKRYKDLTKNSLEEIISSKKDPVESINEIFELSVKGCYNDTSKGCFLVNSTIEFASQDGNALEIVKQSFNDTRNTLLHFIQLGQQNNTISQQLIAEEMADHLQNAISGMIISSKAGMEEESCRKVIANALRILKI